VELLVPFHVLPVLVAEKVQEPVHEGPPPLGADELGAENDVAELARDALGELVPPVDRKREDIGGLVDPQVAVLELPHALGALEGHAEIALFHALGAQDTAAQLHDRDLLQRHAASVFELDADHRRR
jgi:hypothetical protein